MAACQPGAAPSRAPTLGPQSCKRKRAWDAESPPPSFLRVASGARSASFASSASFGAALPSREARAVLVDEKPLDTSSEHPSLPLSEHSSLPLSEHSSLPLSEHSSLPLSEHLLDTSSEHPFLPLSEQPFHPSSDQPFLPLSDQPFIPSLHQPSDPSSDQLLHPSLPSPPETLPQTPYQPEPKLCQEQQELVDLITSGRNVFFTGSAGSGKSTVLKAAIQRLKAMGLTVHVLAPTGRAALQVNGRTTWSYMGWTPDHHKIPMDELANLAFRKFVRHRLKSTDVLIIDEISMIENHHLERINLSMKAARRWKKDDVAAFGGVQVVVTGDFCQLPPVKPFQHCITCGEEMEMDQREIEFDCPNNHGPFREHEKWAFMSDAWEECDFTHVHLKQIHRQQDQHFIKMLQKCRLGIPFSPDETTTLMDHPCHVTNATRLFSTRAEVNKVNLENFSKLRTPIVTYQTLDGFVWRRKQHPHLKHYNNRLADDSLAVLQDHRLERRVELRIGMLVVLLVNLDLEAGLCNGSQGIICGFEDYDPDKIPTSARDNHNALREQQVIRFMSRQGNKVWPRVLFHCGVKRTIYAECVVNSVGSREPSYSLLHRTQIPLVAAWAMSIHKSQGMTLDRVIVNLTKAFEEGQVYVALSRATSLEGLKVEGNPDGLAIGSGGNPDVQQFLREKFGAGLLREHCGTPMGARDRLAS